MLRLEGWNPSEISYIWTQSYNIAGGGVLWNIDLCLSSAW